MAREQGHPKAAGAQMLSMSPSRAPMRSMSRASALTFTLLLLLSFSLAAIAAPAISGFPPTPASLPARSYPIIVSVQDSDGHPVPDVLIMASVPRGDFNKDVTDLSNHTQEAFTDAAGRVRTTLRLSENETTPPSATLSAYTPYWSAAAPPQALPKTQGGEISYNFKISQPLFTYRVRTLDYQGGPVQGVTVRLLKPYFIVRQTDSNGLVSFRLPPNSSVAGQVEIGGSYQPFAFNSSSAEAMQEIQVPIPLRRPLPANITQVFNWSVQILESSGRPLSNKPISLEVGRSSWTFVSDNEGFIHIRALPYARVNLSWVIYNYTYRQEVRLEHAPAVIRAQQLLQLAASPPQALGDSCYRVSVNVTDLRRHPLLQVGARPVLGAGQVLFTLDKETALGAVVQFTRVLCVEADTTFEVVASNPFERAVLSIQLKLANLPPPGASVYARPPPVTTTQSGAAAAERRKSELLLILVYVLAVLAALFLLMHFRTLVLYYFQSIVRFVYTSYRHKPELDDQGEPKKPVKSK